ncbi:flagellar biosynthesis anti-sigma factor FlgM [Legionella jordanis]|uniref:Negative regulator of flagellin synthesis n=1 Tax=Legionella jordanis TaxID=456 RepID=A0A0W0VA86_9GAMM|nr:flagellar biosynthesis anti-sigma factor FlgM [Legionella jordanis]KTD16980.1 flagellin synthesis negative regulator [Legionella jordanis]RMX03121.1 flagellar biosynthesis anti-sigma factor FlgM [Legionella jordanis]VEH12826.1 negative regulator of flagellin synthesis FlgM [Legionella jordanis]
MSAIESTVMVNPINDSKTFNISHSENRLARREAAEKDSHLEDSNLVNLSTLSKQLTQLKESILNAPVVDKGKVEFFKEEIASGRYAILSRNIAERMFVEY